MAKNKNIMEKSITISDEIISFKSVSIAYAEVDRWYMEAINSARKYRIRTGSEIPSLLTVVERNLSDQRGKINEKYGISTPVEIYHNLKYYEKVKNDEILEAEEEDRHIIELANSEAKKRSGSKWYGGGIGITGAIKGKIEADILNGIDSVIKDIGNPMSFEKANRERVKVAKNLIKSILDDAEKIAKREAELYKKSICEKYSETEIIPDKNKEERFIKQIEESENDIKKIAIELLRNNPYELNNYLIVYEKVIETENIENFKQDVINLIELGLWFNLDIKGLLKEGMNERVKSMEITEKRLEQFYSVGILVFNEKKEIDSFWSSIRNRCSKIINKQYTLAKDIRQASSEMNKFDVKHPEVKLIEKYQTFLEFDIKDAEKAIRYEREDVEKVVQIAYAQIEIARKDNYDRVKKLEETFILKEERKILNGLDVSNFKSVIKMEKSLEEFKEAYNLPIDDVLQQRVNSYLLTRSKAIQDKEQLYALENYIKEIEKNTSVKIVEKQKIFQDAYQAACLVMGKRYATLEEAELERKTVVEGRRYETEEKANEERNRIEQEKLKEEAELRVIRNLEKNGAGALVILKEIRKRGFSSKGIKEKERNYEQELINRVKQSEAISEEIRKKSLIFAGCVLASAIVCIVGFYPFISAGIIGKIIIFIIFGIPCGNAMQEHEEISELMKKNEDVEEIKDFLERKC